MLQRGRGQLPWGQVEELLAQIVEEVSVMAAQRVREEPRRIPRPGQSPVPAVAEQGVVMTDDGKVTATGSAGLLAYMSSRTVRTSS